jgi:hypothetical protein
MYDIGLSDLYLHCVVTRLSVLRREIAEFEKDDRIIETNVSSDDDDSSNEVSTKLWQHQAMLEDFIKSYESIMVKMLPAHIQILALLVASLSVPSDSIIAQLRESSPQSPVLPTLQSLNDNMPQSLSDYCYQQQIDSGLKSDNVVPSTRCVHLGLSHSTAMQLLLSIKKLTFKEISKSKSKLKVGASAMLETDVLSISDWIGIVVNYHSLRAFLPDTSPILDEYCIGLYSMDARVKLVKLCCLSPVVSDSSTKTLQINKGISTDTSDFRSFLSTFRILQESANDFIINWGEVVEEVTRETVSSLIVSSQNSFTVSSGQDVVSVLADSPAAGLSNRHVAPKANNFMFVSSWHFVEKLALLCSMVGNGGDSNVMIPESVKEKILVSVHETSKGSLAKEKCDMFVSLAIVVKALLVFTSEASDYRWNATFMYCYVNAYLHAPRTALALGLVADVDTPDHLGTVRWEVFRDFGGGDFAAMESWLESLLAHALTYPTLTKDGAKSVLPHVIQEVQNVLRLLGCSATAGQSDRLSKVWHASSFRSFALSPISDFIDKEPKAHDYVIEMANKCWRQVLSALAAGSVAMKDCRTDDACYFATFYIEILLMDYTYNSSMSSCAMRIAPGGLSLHHLAFGEDNNFPSDTTSPILPPLPVDVVHTAEKCLPEFYVLMVSLTFSS